jgi:hypothetical protein
VIVSMPPVPVIWKWSPGPMHSVLFHVTTPGVERSAENADDGAGAALRRARCQNWLGG